MSTQKRFTYNKRYTYNIGVIDRACGHKEDAGIVESSMAYEPTVIGYEHNKRCKACNAKRALELQQSTEAMRRKAVEYCKEHNIDSTISNITAYEDNAEVTIYIR